MDFAVLVKVVPAVEQLRFDRTRNTVIRAGVPSFLNPYDGRAVRIAVQLRRPGEQVTVLSMGPPEVAPLLRETFAFGADRVILVSDEALAGSDTLVTSRVLSALLRQVGHDLVLAGERTVDSETGQVGPEVAAVLDAQLFTSARSLARADAGDRFEVVTETPSGWSRFRFTPPAVVSVNERILRKAPKPTPEAVARAERMVVELVALERLGFARSEVGLEGSPTQVESVENEEPDRRPQVFGDGPVDARVALAARAVEALLGQPAPPAPALAPVPSSLSDSREVAVLVSGPEGTFDTGPLGAVSELRRWGSRVWPSVVWVGREPPLTERSSTARAGAVRGYHLATHERPVPSVRAAEALVQLLHHRPDLVGLVTASTPFGREVAGRVAARQGLGLTGDAIGLTVRAGTELVWRKPAFGGSWVASITSRTRPSFATVRPGAFPVGAEEGAPPVSVEPVAFTGSGTAPEIVEQGSEAAERWGDLGAARVVVVAGMGLGGPEHLADLDPMRTAWDAALGGTRRVVDAGWLPGSQQVGLTGTSLAADLAVLVGVSGSGNHLVGLRRTRVLLAVNPDPAAPVFQRVDVGIVGGWAEVVPRLTGRLAGVARARSVGSR